MSPEKDRAGEASRSDRLPFEPTRRKKPAKARAEATGTKETQKTPATKAHKAPQAKQESKKVSATKESRAIPDLVSKRMTRRMATLSGVPFVLAIATFFVSYFLLSQTELAIPHVAVVLVSMGFFGLSVLGLSYGLLSASWDEEEPGSVLGWKEFTTNFGRMTAAWRSTKQNE